MTSFKLSKKSTGRTLTTFHVTNARGDICGAINVPNEQASDLQKHWREPGAPAPTAAGAHGRAVNAISAALRKGPRLSREGVLRGC
jgi:hypothetical protein